MPNLIKLNVARILCQCLHTTSGNFNKYFSREGKFMGKIMRGERQGKRKWFNNEGSMEMLPGPFTLKKSGAPQNSRRVSVLNKLFMKHITDLMATGEVAPEILGKGIEVSRVRVTPDFNQVHVYWLAKGTDKKDNEVEMILEKSARQLRHELSQLRVMGVVPMIQFVKDKQYAIIAQVEQKLALADFGEDFEPTDPSLRLRTIPVISTKLSQEVKLKIEELENSHEDDVHVVEEPLPDMTTDVLGLNHFRIMAKVKSSMDKSSTAALNRALNVASPETQIPTMLSSEVAEYLTIQQQKEAFTDFLIKRQIQEKRKKNLGLEKNYKPELELFMEEWKMRDNSDNLDEDFDFEKDFNIDKDIDEDIDFDSGVSK